MPHGRPLLTLLVSPRFSRAVIVVLLLALFAPVFVAAGPATAQQPGTEGTEGTATDAGETSGLQPEQLSLEELQQLEQSDIGVLIPDPELSPGVDRVSATSPEYNAAIDAYLNQLRLIAEARSSLGAAKENLIGLEASKVDIRERLTRRRRNRRTLVYELDRIENHLRAMAVSEYVSSGTTDAHTQIQGLDPEVIHDGGRSIQLIEEVGEVQIENRATFEASLRKLDNDQARDEKQLAEVALAVTTTQNDIEDWSIALFESSTKVPELETAVRDNRRLAFIPELQFDVVVLDAYNNAAIASEQIHPGCGVQWWMLAGIGRVESRHGTYNGTPNKSSVDAAGFVTPQIIGIPLNGNSETAVITDTDGGLLDRDPIFDRAVGPMQFIPSTWAGNGLDGDGDGDANPHNLYDAALSAAHYLCRTAGNVTTSDGLRRGYFAYNHHDSYVNLVYGFALGYREFEL